MDENVWKPKDGIAPVIGYDYNNGWLVDFI